MTGTDTTAAPALRGPYADGVPSEALRVDAPSIDGFGLHELRRMFVVLGTIVFHVVKGAARKVTDRRMPILEHASTGLIDAFFVLGPTFVKTGQIIASSPGLFPEAVSRPAQKCLQEVPPFAVEQVHAMIEGDLGRPTRQIFADFDDEPLSAASVGQVHACTLPDGRKAVVKLQRPNIHERMNTDLRILYRIARLLHRTKLGRRANAIGQVTDLHKLTNQELNTSLEAHRQHLFRSTLHAYGDNDLVYTPEVYWDYCGPHVICMERVFGVPMDDFESLTRLAADPRANLRRGMKAWVEALCVHGPFHGDLHAGNIWALEDGRNCFLDFGIMGHLEPEWQQMVKDILFTFMIDQDFSRIVAGYKSLGVIDPKLGDDAQLAEMMRMAFEPILASKMEDLNFGELFQQSLEMAEQLGDISAPEEFTLLGKQFLYFERYVKGIAPDYLIVADPFIIKNIFPEEAAAKIAELQAADPTALIDPDNPPDPNAVPAAPATSTTTVSAAPATPSTPSVVLPDVDYDGPTYAFLTGEWFTAVEPFWADSEVPDAIADLVLNLTVDGAPVGADRAHLRGGRPGPGHVAEAGTTVTMPYDVARALVVSLDPAPALQAMMSGRVVVEGDPSTLMAMQTNVTTPSDADLRTAAEVRARTAIE